MRRTIRYSAIFSLGVIIVACAQVKPPTGGPKDQIPPQVIASAPLNYSTNFSARKIILEFDEYVQLRNLSSQLIINPSMEERPEFRLRGKKLIIDLKSPLNPNTTYVINFGDAIVDLTEGNKAAGLKYVFATGNALDSLMFHGQVIDGFQRKPVSDALVMLYSNPSDTMPYKGIPDYFSKTDAQGRFEIGFIREGEYMAFALKDANSNYRYDPPTEAIGYLDSLVAPGPPDSTNMPVLFQMFNEPDTIQYIEDRKGTYYGQYQLVLHTPADSVSVTPVDTRFKLIWEHGVNGDTITTWFVNRNAFPKLESTELVVRADSGFVDTVTWQFKKPKDDTEPQMVIRDNLLYNFNPYAPMSLRFNHPLAEVDTAYILLYRDSVEVDFSLNTGKSPRTIEIRHSWEPGASYRIFAPEKTFIDVFGLTNDTLDKAVEMRPERYFGNLKFDLQFDPSTPIVLEMLNERDEIVKRILPNFPGELNFERMKPGVYSIRVIYDLNGNGKWDTGHFGMKLQPEPVRLFERNIQIRSNWDLELSWDLNAPEQ